MLKRNQKIVWSVIAIIALCFSYGVGSILTYKAALRDFTKQYNDSQIRVGYGRYIGYRNIATNIEKQKYDYAKCAADLSASSLYDELTTCLADKECSKLIDKEKEYKIAPELFDKKPAGFKYYADKDGVRSCE